MLLFILASCSQHYQITLLDSPTIQGKVEASMQLETVFTRYLQDIDLFSGIDKADDQLPSIASDLLTEFASGSRNYRQKIEYNPTSKKFLVKYSFDFDDIKKIFGPDDDFFNSLITTNYDGTNQVIVIKFDELARRRMQQIYPIIPPPATPISPGGKSTYINDITTMVASTRQERPIAEQELISSTIKLAIKAPRPIKSIEGGTISHADSTIALFQLTLLDLLYPTKALYYKLAY